MGATEKRNSVHQKPKKLIKNPQNCYIFGTYHSLNMIEFDFIHASHMRHLCNSRSKTSPEYIKMHFDWRAHSQNQKKKKPVYFFNTKFQRNSKCKIPYHGYCAALLFQLVDRSSWVQCNNRSQSSRYRPHCTETHSAAFQCIISPPNVAENSQSTALSNGIFDPFSCRILLAPWPLAMSFPRCSSPCGNAITEFDQWLRWGHKWRR